MYSNFFFTSSFSICCFLFIFLYSFLKTPKVFNRFLNIFFVNIPRLFNKLFILTADVLFVQNFFNVVYKNFFYIFFRYFNNWCSFIY